MGSGTGFGYALFETGIGRCAVAWSARGIVRVQLPEATDAQTIARLVDGLPAALQVSALRGLASAPYAGESPPPDAVALAVEPAASPPPEAVTVAVEPAASPPEAVTVAIGQMTALLDGRPCDLDGIELDMTGVAPFHRLVYQLVRTIPPGETLSYGEVAAKVGSPGGGRAVGQALRRNPYPIVVPCHRVLAAGGKLGGFSAPGGLATKVEMLAREATPSVAGAAPGGRETLPSMAGEASGGREALPSMAGEASGGREALPSVAGDAAAGLGGLGGVGGTARLAGATAAAPSGASLGFDPAQALRRLRRADPVMARLIKEVGPLGLQLSGAPTTFAALSRSIVYQQLHGRAAAAIYARLGALFPQSGSALAVEDVMAASDEELRGAGLSRAKMLALRDLAERSIAGEVPTLAETETMEDEEIIEELSHVRGIGRWSAEMFLIFTLGRPDVLPVGDFGVRKGFAARYQHGVMPTPKELSAFGERWKPYRSVASWYLWRAAEADKPRQALPPDT